MLQLWDVMAWAELTRVGISCLRWCASAVAFFSFVLAVIYGCFSVLLFIFRREIPEAGGSAGGDSYA